MCIRDRCSIIPAFGVIAAMGGSATGLAPILPHGRATHAGLSKVMVNLVSGPYRGSTAQPARDSFALEVLEV